MNPSVSEVLEEATRRALQGVYTALPATVEGYDPATQTADCKPSIKRRIQKGDGSAEYQELPTIPKVPVAFPRGGGFVLSLPLAKGDRVLLVFSQAPIGEWQATGQVAEPLDGTLHGLGHCFAVPGVYPLPEPLSAADLAARTAGAVLGKDGAAQQIRIGEAQGIQLGGETATIPLTLSTPLLAHIALQTSALSSIVGSLTALQGYCDALNLLLAGAAAPAAATSATALIAASGAVTSASTPPTVGATLVKGI